LRNIKERIPKQIPYWILAASVLVGLTLPILIQEGMFMDAMLYTSVSHNLGQGIGTFWFPQFSKLNLYGLSAFHEQPPLVFGIQALFFKVLGDSVYVERFYTFTCMVVTALLIVVLWREIFKKNEEFKVLGWLPLILWITIPVCFWSFSNNMHENTMGIFTLASVYFSYRGLRSKDKNILWFLLAGFAIFLATMSKGIPGFFPLGVPILYWLVFRSITLKEGIYLTLKILFVPFLLYSILFVLHESSQSLSTYLFERALHRINSDPTVSSRFYVFERLFSELIPQILITGLIVFITRKRGYLTKIRENKLDIVFFFLIGISGSLPLVLTMVQKGFYMVPSLPFFGIGFGLILAPMALDLVNFYSSKGKLLLLLSVLVFTCVLIFAGCQIGKISRDKELIQDIKNMGVIVPKYSVVKSSPELLNDWELQCYLIRYLNISLDYKPFHQYLILKKNITPIDDQTYEKIPIKTELYDLYQKSQAK
jgi:4-amino-4-deoxy-L-arabinose transferase-like glycosyltransferase